MNILPNELLALILSYVNDYKDLKQLILINTTWLNLIANNVTEINISESINVTSLLYLSNLNKINGTLDLKSLDDVKLISSLSKLKAGVFEIKRNFTHRLEFFIKQLFRKAIEDFNFIFTHLDQDIVNILPHDLTVYCDDSHIANLIIETYFKYNRFRVDSITSIFEKLTDNIVHFIRNMPDSHYRLTAITNNRTSVLPYLTHLTLLNTFNNDYIIYVSDYVDTSLIYPKLRTLLGSFDFDDLLRIVHLFPNLTHVGLYASIFNLDYIIARFDLFPSTITEITLYSYDKIKIPKVHSRNIKIESMHELLS